MATADGGLARSRAALTMIQPEPFNAEAPPEALTGAITPTGLHYVRSNFALPVHDGVLAIGGAVHNPITLTLDDLRGMLAAERAVTMECAGNGRLAQTPLPAPNGTSGTFAEHAQRTRLVTSSFVRGHTITPGRCSATFPARTAM